MASASDDDFVRHYHVPSTFAEQIALSKQFRGEWRQSASDLKTLRSVDDLRLADGAMFAMTDARRWAAYWYQEHVDSCGVAPFEHYGRRLAPKEYASAVTASWHFWFWDWASRLMQAAWIQAESEGQSPFIVAWDAALKVCEVQAPLLDGGLVLLGMRLNKAGRCQLKLEVPIAKVVAWCGAGLSVSPRFRLGRALQQLAPGAVLEDALLEELQSVVLTVLPEKFEDLLASPLGVRQHAARTIERLVNLEHEAVLADVDVGQRSLAAQPPDSLELWEVVEGADLTPRQHTVLDDELAGFAINETAERLGVAPGTIKATRSQVREKLRRAAN